VKDEVIEKMFVERDGFEVMPVGSNAETMLNYYINPSSGKETRSDAVPIGSGRCLLLKKKVAQKRKEKHITKHD
jgi:glutathione-dependent peroxiredoxin